MRHLIKAGKAGLMLATICATGLLSSAVFAQDVTQGEKIFKKCAVCHKIGADAKNAAGPVLSGVIGRTAGTFADFKYSKSMIKAGENGLVWGPEIIAEYITNPKKFLRAFLDDKKAKAKMVFKLKDEQDRLDVIAYVATFSAAQGAEEAVVEQPSEIIKSEVATLRPENVVCVENSSDRTHIFAVEAGPNSRLVKELKVGQTLCTTGAPTPISGVVSVYENEDSFEGCSRIVTSGVVEKMIKYSEFDRCAWSSNS